MKSLISAFLVVILSQAAIAQDSLRLNGITTYNKLNRDYFIAALFLQERNSSADEIINSYEPSKLSMKVVQKKLSARQFNQYWLTAININNDEEDLDIYDEEIIRFTQLFKNSFIYGDEITISFTRDFEINVHANNQLISSFDNSGFYPVLLNAWLGPRPTSREFKAELLKLPNSVKTAELIDTHTQLLASPERQKESKKWRVKPAKKSNNQQRLPPSFNETISTPSSAKISAPKPVNTQQAASSPLTPPVSGIQTASLSPTLQSPKLTATANATASDVTTQKSVAIEQQASKQLSIMTMYRSNILKTTYQHIIYPNLAIDEELEGDVVIAITLDRSGEVIDIDQLESAAHHSLNNAAIKAIQQSQYPSPPNSLEGNNFVVKLPIKFRLPK
ncbi:hypothetical protein SIN8267_02383 [Sinobacterium norvegicum]|uniref:TonB C-terminal domain-containing protein n=1 Tax=Sinobacterium norvegicum TaxID=1641715 RepID=A0ABN8EIQ1_9GAMM|nr:TonB family protein [Sinobacterium norvegicum]CAH0992264.1 hypothetical protein SIN8267_02383 [Sinobacterium norvegicum]